MLAYLCEIRGRLQPWKAFGGVYLECTTESLCERGVLRATRDR